MKKIIKIKIIKNNLKKIKISNKYFNYKFKKNKTQKKILILKKHLLKIYRNKKNIILKLKTLFKNLYKIKYKKNSFLYNLYFNLILNYY